MIRSYLCYKLFIWYHFLLIRLSLFLLCVYCYIIIFEMIFFIQHPFLIIILLFSHAYNYIGFFIFSSLISMLK